LETLNKSYHILSNVYAKKGDYKLANTNLKLYVNLKDSISSIKLENLSPQKAQLIIDNQDALIQDQLDEINKKRNQIV